MKLLIIDTIIYMFTMCLFPRTISVAKELNFIVEKLVQERTFFVCLLLGDRVSLCTSGCPGGAHSVDQAHGDAPASAS